ncbi:unknown [[Mannheimia] succiniciproducens MBEL55E]|uniref:Uncharacterized protein n=1 Tax=Mannheimia succiniciproducens (strain KCTC 0769BP / MBEL55E) TaxID=221988 RepID=Q65WL6_MANSM|nr:unknown [[Mannheimia] succiniciproducens MBEL55E]
MLLKPMFKNNHFMTALLIRQRKRPQTRTFLL